MPIDRIAQSASFERLRTFGTGRGDKSEVIGDRSWVTGTTYNPCPITHNLAKRRFERINQATNRPELIARKFHE